MFLKIVRFALSAALIGLLPLTCWFARELESVRPEKGEAGLDVERGLGVKAIARVLEENGVIRHRWPFLIGYQLFLEPQSLKAGEYRFTSPPSTKDVLLLLAEGKVFLHQLTIPEGLTAGETADLIAARNLPLTGSLPEAFQDASAIADWDPKARSLEGYLFPDTYHFPKNTSAGFLADSMVGQFKRMFLRDWRGRAATLGMSIREVVTLASLIEKETSVPEERKLVSAVFHNRLRIGMKLDCDPTVIFALKTDGLYEGRLLIKDLRHPSPYNTYVFPGLPPGPICNPGRRSLEAALYPAPDRFLYFVSRNDGSGSHEFTASIREHQAAVRKSRLEKNENR